MTPTELAVSERKKTELALRRAVRVYAREGDQLDAMVWLPLTKVYFRVRNEKRLRRYLDEVEAQALQLFQTESEALS